MYLESLGFRAIGRILKLSHTAGNALGNGLRAIIQGLMPGAVDIGEFAYKSAMLHTQSKRKLTKCKPDLTKSEKSKQNGTRHLWCDQDVHAGVLL